MGEDFFFLSRWGVHRLSKTQADRQIGIVEPVSAKIQETIDRINWTYAHQARGVLWDNHYLLAVPLDSATTNSHVLVYDVRHEGWSLFDNMDVGAWAVSDVSGYDRLYFGNQTGSGKVLEALTGTTDESSAITSSVATRRIDLERPHVNKLFDYAEVHAVGFDGGEVVVAASKEGGGFNNVGTVALDVDQPNLPIALPFDLNDSTTVSKKVRLRGLGHMRDIQIKLTTTESAEVEVLGVSVTGYYDEETFE